MSQPEVAPVAPARRAPIGAILLAIGGALTAISSFLAWAAVEVTIDLSEFGVPSQTENVNVKGIDGTDGYITLIAGVIMIAAAVALFLSRSGSARRGLAILAIVGGVAATGLGVYDLVRLEAQFQEEVTKEIQKQAPGTDVNSFLELVTFDVSASIGLYGVIAGGIIGLVGGVIGSRTAGAAETVPPPPPAAFGGTPPPPPVVGGTPSSEVPPGGSPPSAPPPPAVPPPAGAP